MDRITQRDLGILVDRINTITKSPMTSWTRNGEKGDRKIGFTANVGNYHLSYAYSGVKLERMHNKGGGVEVISNGGFGTKRELYNWLQAFIAELTN